MCVVLCVICKARQLQFDFGETSISGHCSKIEKPSTFEGDIRMVAICGAPGQLMLTPAFLIFLRVHHQ